MKTKKQNVERRLTSGVKRALCCGLSASLLVLSSVPAYAGVQQLDVGTEHIRLEQVNAGTIRVEQGNGIELQSTITHTTEYISFAQVRQAVGAAGKAAEVVGFFLLFVPGASTVKGIADGVDIVLSSLHYMIPNDTSHGFKLSIKVEKFYRTRGGRRYVWSTQKTITKVQRY